MTVMKSHKIYTLAQLQSGQIVFKSKLRDEVPKCGKHQDQNLNVYCNSCEQVICTTCSVLDHAKHSLIGLPAAAEKCKKKVREMVQKSERRKTELSTTIEETSKSRKDLDTMFANTQKKISKKAQQEITKLKQEVAKIKKEIAKIQNEEQKLLQATDMIYKDKLKTFEAVQATNRKEVTHTEHKLEEGGCPTGVSCDSDDSIYVAVGRYQTGDILHYSPDGKYIGCVIKGCGYPRGITFTSNGDLVVATGQSVQVYHGV
ncbi:E3 ubiquitin-protein ligase TRIM71-like [Patiria miniata]|uniref:B box-type domain-containing protein n=1 Tax=Patiria miniata TaxID=46514 RepID=A0A913ZTY2_PATMI|nr:E3 ubiquitin-protein ligase TRIM71-like [Patiria miniata]